MRANSALFGSAPKRYSLLDTENGNFQHGYNMRFISQGRATSANIHKKNQTMGIKGLAKLLSDEAPDVS